LTVNYLDEAAGPPYPRPMDDDDVAIPALLRAARGSYAQSITAHLAAAGFDDLPRNGPFVLGGLVTRGGSAARVIEGLGVTKQAASQLIDLLVLRGYVQRAINPEDHRRMTITVTERGQAAAAAVRAGVEAVDAELRRLISPAELAGLRSGLTALSTVKERAQARP
jgi:DNA-binding MarR family transcriptional regulator